MNRAIVPTSAPMLRDRVALFVRSLVFAVWLVASNVGAAYLIRWVVASSLGRPVDVWPIIVCIFVLPLLVGRRRSAQP